MRDERQIPFCQEHRARMYHFTRAKTFPKASTRLLRRPPTARVCPIGKCCFPWPISTKSSATMYLDGVSHYVGQQLRVLLSLSAGGRRRGLHAGIRFGRAAHRRKRLPLSGGQNHVAWRDRKQRDGLLRLGRSPAHRIGLSARSVAARTRSGVFRRPARVAGGGKLDDGQRPALLSTGWARQWI